MTNDSKKSSATSTDTDDNALDKLRGSELHHDLKNNPGEDGKDGHTSEPTSEKVKKSVKEALSGKDEDTSVSSAMKKAAKD